ncbi:MAG: DUF2461 domain-containing protein [Bryobacteraceae bacterium]
MPGFRGFPEETIPFFRDLKKNNNREWFQPRKELFEAKVRAPMVDLVEALNAWLSAEAPEFVTEPGKAIYRIYRDTRFSKDKTPYKDHIGAIFPHKHLGKHSGGGFYVGITDTGAGVAGGVYGPTPQDMLVLRTRFAEASAEFDRLTRGKTFAKLMGELKGEQLARMPKGFPTDHPAGDLLRRKQWYWYAEMNENPKLIESAKLLGEITKRFAAALPAVRWMNEPLVAAVKKAESRVML